MSPQVLQTISGEQAAHLTLELVRTGQARPDMLAESLDCLSSEQRRGFLRAIQKSIERDVGCPQLSPIV